MSVVKDWRTYPPGREKYHLYLASREWALLKEALRERSEGVCERCNNADATQCHHQTYQRLYRERLEDLLHVCGECHEILSGKAPTEAERKAERDAEDRERARRIGDVTDRELVAVAWHHPDSIPSIQNEVPFDRIRDSIARRALPVLFAFHDRGESPVFADVAKVLSDEEQEFLKESIHFPGYGLAAHAWLKFKFPPWQSVLSSLVEKYTFRAWETKLQELSEAIKKIDQPSEPDRHKAAFQELCQHLEDHPNKPRKNPQPQ